MTVRLPLLSAYGVELEYMIVDAASLDVRPRADAVLRDGDGAVVSEIEHGTVAWSNELAAHVVELKTNGPAAQLAGLASTFQDHVGRLNALLDRERLRLMPTAMHPWMDPHRELVLWPHEYGPVYECFNRIFDCRGHGWANLQSTHLNLPFDTDDAFRRLHAAVRLVLPLIPALAASSPVIDGERRPHLDTRLAVYRTNARRVPSVSGHVIPEAVESEAEYEREILEPIYADLAPFDPEGILRHEWVNARGAIARFTRGSIEIRLIDIQEHPAADLAILAAIVALLRRLIDERTAPYASQRDVTVASLAAFLEATTAHADRAVIPDGAYLDLLGMPAADAWEAGDVWRQVVASEAAALQADPAWRAPLDVIDAEGCLARRIATRLGDAPARGAIRDVYAELCDCLARGASFRAAG